MDPMGYIHIYIIIDYNIIYILYILYIYTQKICILYIPISHHIISLQCAYSPLQKVPFFVEALMALMAACHQYDFEESQKGTGLSGRTYSM